jgi:hypothetical protein
MIYHPISELIARISKEDYNDFWAFQKSQKSRGVTQGLRGYSRLKGPASAGLKDLYFLEGYGINSPTNGRRGFFE